ncbi:MAG: S-layer homology domain-containing protein [Candidatus Margulisiibacteriota bacterium]
MILIFKIFGVVLSITIFVSAAEISDVKTSDPAYSAVSESVNKGYLTLVDGSKFLPNQSVTRKELAILIDRLDALTKKSGLSPNDIVELKDFSKQFKSYLESQQNQKGFVDSEVNQIKTEQKTINYDLSRVEDHVQQVEKQSQEQQVYIWLGVGLGVLGLLK